MKKLFPLSLLVLFVLMLVSCGDKYYSTKDFTYVIENGGLSLVECNIDGPVDVTIVDVEENGKKVLSIDDMVFYKSKTLESIYIPDTVKTVGDACFGYCSKLKSVRLSPSMYMITLRTFMYCTGLEEINIPEGIKMIESHAFSHCTALKNVVIPSSIKEIDSSAFYLCSSMEYAFYAGTEEDWNKIKIQKYYNDNLLDNLYYYSETELSGNYWHYVDGVATAW